MNHQPTATIAACPLLFFEIIDRPITESASVHRPKMSKKASSRLHPVRRARQVIPNIRPYRIIQIEVLRVDARIDQHDVEQPDKDLGKPRIHAHREILPEGRLRAHAKVERRPVQQRNDRHKNQNDDGRSVRPIFLSDSNPVHRRRPLIGRHGRHLLFARRALRDRLLRHTVEADLLIDRKRRSHRHDDKQKKRQPPTRAAKDVGERFAGRDKRVHHPLCLRKPGALCHIEAPRSN